MKIVIVHYRYFETGGPERYLFNIIKLLKNDGHDVIPFSVQHNKNLPSKYHDYFLSKIGDGNVTYAYETRSNLVDVIKTISRQFYSFEAKSKFKKLLLKTKPDLVYVLQYQSKISPSIFWAAFSLNIPTVLRISDYSQICANNILFNFKLNSVCERCIHGSNLNAVKYRCVNNSIVQSFIKSAAISLHQALGLKDKINKYIIPSKFTISRFENYGIDEDKIVHLPTFYNGGFISRDEVKYEPYALFVGRVDIDKGIETLIDAFISSGRKLIIIGDSSADYRQKLNLKLSKVDHNILFLGKLPFNEIKNYLKECLFTICPSIWYENFPNSVLESFAHFKAVIASDIGSLNEMVIEGKTGLLFSVQDSIKLEEKCEQLFNDVDYSKKLGENANLRLFMEFSVEKHYTILVNLFKQLSVSNNEKNCQ